MFFEYDEDVMAYLCGRDEKLGVYIRKYGKIYRQTVPDVFVSLVRSMLAQQISNKAFLTVYGRVEHVCCGSITAENILGLDAESLCSCGVSARKAQNIFALAEYFLQNRIAAKYFENKSDEEIIKELAGLPGIGVWTAEMFLLFTLQRQDILSYGDFGIKKGLCLVHGLDKINKKIFSEFKKLYSPFGSAASLYLWEIANTFKGEE